ncbi:MAG: HEAT repeat domain-containing protein [Methanobacterium sp.]|nr:HEAT repeat domain-containing protein [Methanobacterium sp.]
MSDDGFYPDINVLEKNRDVEGLIRALNNDDYLIRKEAARSLKKVGDSRAIVPLIQSLQYEKWQSKNTILGTVREFSAEALGKLGDSRAVKPLIYSMNEDDDVEVRWKSAWALGEIGDSQATDALIEALKSSSWNVRENAAGSLGKLRAIDAVEPLIATLEDKEWRVRKNSVVALGKIGDEKAIKPLLNLLSDEDSDVRRKTIEVLANMGDKAFNPLMDLFYQKDWYIRSKAAKVLGEIGDKRVVEPFIEVLSKKRKADRNRYVRGRVVEALGKIGDLRAINALTDALDDDTIFVRQKAEEAIIRIRSLDYSGEFTQFSDGSISFNYPVDWIINTIVTHEKYEGHNPHLSVKLTIYKKSDLEDLTFDDLIKIWDEIFEYQNIIPTTQNTSRMGKTNAFFMMGESMDTNNVIIIVGYMLYEIFYYLHFTIKPNVTDREQEDIDLIINTFRIHI